MIIIIVLTLTSFILVKILLRPLSNNLILLDRFIKDTTHELNTPISAILGNIETLDYSTIGQNNLKKIDRIKIASSTISNIYDDLSFLLLQNYRHSKDLNLDISYILKQRIEYFTPMANAQRLKFQVDIANNIILIIDQVKIERLFDNLISNAIKYSKPHTTIQIKLDQNMFSIEDQGCGMTKEQINEIFIRYKRFNNTVGGFGIGYSIIKTITDQYNIKINIISNIDQGTKVELLWSK
jgi:two-component system OmpR family sensor kinase